MRIRRENGGWMEADEFDCVKTTFQGKCHTPVSGGGRVLHHHGVLRPRHRGGDEMSEVRRIGNLNRSAYRKYDEVLGGGESPDAS